VSYTRERVTDNLAASFKPTENAPYSIAVLHANVGHQSGHADYAPATVNDLNAAGFNYWLWARPHAVGCLRPNRRWWSIPAIRKDAIRAKSGPRGCYQVDVDTYGRAHLEFIDTSMRDGCTSTCSIRNCSTMDQLVDSMLNRAREEICLL